MGVFIHSHVTSRLSFQSSPATFPNAIFLPTQRFSGLFCRCFQLTQGPPLQEVMAGGFMSLYFVSLTLVHSIEFSSNTDPGFLMGECRLVRKWRLPKSYSRSSSDVPPPPPHTITCHEGNVFHHITLKNSHSFLLLLINQSLSVNLISKPF